MMENVLLDFEITPEQMQAMQLHSIFKQKGVYDNIDSDDDFDKVQIWFQASYNDNWYDVEPIYFDIIKDDKIIKKIKPYAGSEIEIREYVGVEYEMQSFTINKNML